MTAPESGFREEGKRHAALVSPNSSIVIFAGFRNPRVLGTAEDANRRGLLALLLCGAYR